eukprot:2614515-Prymnesium_polylepis.1
MFCTMFTGLPSATGFRSAARNNQYVHWSSSSELRTQKIADLIQLGCTRNGTEVGHLHAVIDFDSAPAASLAESIAGWRRKTEARGRWRRPRPQGA